MPVQAGEGAKAGEGVAGEGITVPPISDEEKAFLVERTMELIKGGMNPNLARRQAKKEMNKKFGYSPFLEGDTEGFKKGGKKGKSKPKVRGAGIERKGLRPAKMR